MKRIMILCICIILLLSGCSSSSEPAATSGSFYVLEEKDLRLHDGVLTVNGQGYVSLDTVGLFDPEAIEEIVFSDSITAMSTDRFNQLPNLRKVIVGTGMESLCDFQDCPMLEEIVFQGDQIRHLGSFADCTGMKTLQLPEGLETLEAMAFSGCFSLERICIPGSVSHVGDFAFSDCMALSEVVLVEGVGSIGDYVFQNCVNLKSLHLPSSLVLTGHSVFTGASGLETVSVAEGNEWYRVDEQGIVYFHDSVLLFAPGSLKGDIVIPEGVKTIVDEAFMGRQIDSVTFPESLAYVNHRAFMNCDGLTELSLPGHIEYCGDEVFAGCTGLRRVVMAQDSEITTLGRKMFRHCAALEEISIPGSVLSVLPEAFQYCDSLRQVSFGGTQEQWDSIAFYWSNEALLEAELRFFA